MKRIVALFAILILAITALVGCGGNTESGVGTFRVMLADAPDPTVTSLVLTIDRIQANLNGQWVDVASEPQVIDLLDLTQEAMVAGSAGLPPGQVNQVRLFISSAEVTTGEGTQSVTVPSSAQTGVKVNVNATVEASGITAVLLDFNVSKSLRRLGNGTYLLQPVIPAVLMQIAGTVSGSVSLDTVPVHGATVTAVYTAGTSYPLGTEVNTSATAEDGRFKVWALKEGTYTLNVSYEDETSVYAGSVTGVVVVRQADAAVGEIALALVP